MNDYYNIIDLTMVFACAIGMLYKSRAAAVVALFHFIISKILIHREVGIRLSPVATITAVSFIYFYAKAIQGTFTYHKIEKKNNPQYKAPAKWTYYVGIPVGIVCVGLIIL